MFDGNIVSSLRTFIHLKGVERLGSKTSKIAKPIEDEFIPEVRPKRGWSFP